jgi:dienelactone hydrolase
MFARLWLVTLYLAATNLIAAVYTQAADDVVFNSASTPPSKLKIRQAKAKGIELKAEPGLEVSGKLGVPTGDGPFPALVLMHDCQGIRPFQDRWAAKFNEWGYVTLQVDSFGPRNATNVCEDLISSSLAEPRAMDAFGALSYLESLPYVQAHNIGAIGWAHGATLSIAFRDGTRQLFDHGFKAVVSFYPDCTLITSANFVDPLLIVSPEKDDWTNPELCKRIASEGENVEIIELPDALRGFDDPEMGERTVRDTFQNTFKVPALGVTFGYASDAHKETSEKLQQYLAEHLK